MIFQNIWNPTFRMRTVCFWCFPWTIAALAGINICLRKIDAKKIFELIKRHNVSNLCGTTVIINMLIHEGIKLDRTVELMIGAAPPPVSVLKKIQELNYRTVF